MDEFIERRKRLHQHIGVFGYSAEFTRLGVVTASSQIRGIGAFLTHLATAADLPIVGGDQSPVSSWIGQRLSTVACNLPSVSSLEELQSGVPPFLEWDGAGDFAELLNLLSGDRAYSSAAAKLRSRGFETSLIDLLGLTEQFQLVVLRNAVRSFDLRRGEGHEDAWLTTVFYRYALRSLLADRANRSYLSALDSRSALEIPSASDDSHWTEEQGALLLSNLPRLPPLERTALQLYFGFDGPEKTLAEIGDVLQCSEFKARSAVIRGMAALTALTDSPAGLTAIERTLLQQTTVEGRSLAAVAKSLGLSYLEARDLYSRIGRRFGVGLRKRTVSRPQGAEKEDL